MQNLAARSDTQQHELYSKRKQHYACHLMFVAKVYKEEVDNARHAHIEQPEKALSWRATAFKDLPGYWIVLHQCMFGYGYACLEQDGWWKLLKKPTGILPSKVSMQAALSKQCDGQHFRCPLEGSASGFSLDLQPQLQLPSRPLILLSYGTMDLQSVSRRSSLDVLSSPRRL